jgi:hypothetical protein
MVEHMSMIQEPDARSWLLVLTSTLDTPEGVDMGCGYYVGDLVRHKEGDT